MARFLCLCLWRSSCSITSLSYAGSGQTQCQCNHGEPAFTACNGPSPEKCVSCNPGYTLDNELCDRARPAKPDWASAVNDTTYNAEVDALETCASSQVNIQNIGLKDHKNGAAGNVARKQRRAQRRVLYTLIKQQRNSLNTCNEDLKVDVDDWLPRKKSLTKGRWSSINRVKLLAPKSNDECAVDISTLAADEAFDCVHENNDDECVACNGPTKIAKVTLVNATADTYTCECWDGSWQSQNITDDGENEYCVCDGHAFGIDSLSGSEDECGVVNGDNSTCTDACGVVNGDNSTCSGCTDSFAVNHDASATVDDNSCTYLSPGDACTDQQQCGVEACTNNVCECIEVGQKVHMADGSLRAVEHLRPGDVLRTPEGHTTVRSTRRGGRHLSAVHDVECAGNRGAITGNHAYHCEGEWRLPQETHRPRALEGTTEVVAIETDNFCEDRLILESGLEVETWDGRGVEEWRPHSYENGRRLRCTLKGSWRDRVLKRVDSKN